MIPELPGSRYNVHTGCLSPDGAGANDGADTDGGPRGWSGAAPTRLLEGLAEAGPEALSMIEISPSGLGLHWPVLDADVYVPSLLDGVFGTRSWMAEPGVDRERARRPGHAGRAGSAIR
ncbi:MAG: DUF2442 domain-containing protein [Rhodobacter sp.]|nr:DUF2442 domain-containing protein [Rhodobacter sp.]